MDAHQLDANGVILNTIVVDSLDVLPDLVDAAIGGQIGDSIINGIRIPKPPALPAVPQSITMRQARLGLLGAGYLATVESAVAAMTGSAGQETQIWWEYSSDVVRNAPLVSQLGAAVGLTIDQIDQLFITASTL